MSLVLSSDIFFIRIMVQRRKELIDEKYLENDEAR